MRPFGARLAAAARPLRGRITGAKRARSGPKRSPGAAGWGTPQRPGTGAGGARPWAMRGWSNAQARLHPVSVLAWPQHAAACITMDLVAGGQERASTVAGAGICAGAGTNEPDMDVWKVYSANGTHGPAPSAPHQQVMSSERNTRAQLACGVGHHCQLTSALLLLFAPRSALRHHLHRLPGQRLRRQLGLVCVRGTACVASVPSIEMGGR